MDVEKIVSEGVIKLLHTNPFYGNILLSIGRIANNKVKSFSLKRGRDGNEISLHYNPEFVKSLIKKYNNDNKTIDIVMGYIMHNVLHITLSHIQRSKGFKIKPLFDLASDVVVNQIIKPERLEDDAFTLDALKKLLPQEQIVENEKTSYYYDLLEKHTTIIKLPTNFMDWGSGRGNGHDSWEELADGDFLDSYLSSVIKNSLNSTNQAIGSLSGEQQDAIQDMLNKFPPNINWRDMIKKFGQNSESTYIKSTRKKISKRFNSAPGIKIKKTCRLLVCIDTSGSVSNNDLSEFFCEINYLHETNCEVHILECDTEVKNEPYEFEGVTPKFVNGRGGTDMSPAMEYFMEDNTYDGLIYFTDGYIPQIKEYHTLPLWVITTNGIVEKSDSWNELQGTVVKMNNV